MTRKPIFKTIHPAFTVHPGVTRIANIPEVAVEMEDENGSVLHMLRLMDGSRTVDQLWRDMQEHDAALTYEEIAEAVEELHRLGFLYEAEEKPRLTDEQRERFKGNLNLFTHYARFDTHPEMFQERLLNAQITVLGMGAFGSSILFQLAGLGVRRVRIVDFDTVSLSNLNRQMLFKEADIGRPKLDVAREFIAQFYSTMEVETLPMEIRCKEDAAQAVVGSDLVFLAADQPFFLLPHWVNEACVEAGIPMIGGGIMVKQGTMFAILPGETGCLDCMLLHRSEQAEDFAEIMERTLDLNFIVPNMANAPNLMMLSGMIVSEGVRYLTRITPMVTPGRVTMLDFETLQTSVSVEFDRKEQCPTCGKGRIEDHPVLQLMARADYNARPVVER